MSKNTWPSPASFSSAPAALHFCCCPKGAKMLGDVLSSTSRTLLRNFQQRKNNRSFPQARGAACAQPSLAPAPPSRNTKAQIRRRPPSGKKARARKRPYLGRRSTGRRTCCSCPCRRPRPTWHRSGRSAPGPAG